MGLTYPQGLIAVALAVMCFYGMTYVVIALNVGWRFGYWLSSARSLSASVDSEPFRITTALEPLAEMICRLVISVERLASSTWMPVWTVGSSG